MNIIVTVKQTFDTEAKIALGSDGKPSADGVQLVVNPYDEYAIEEALKLKERFGGEVTVVNLGGEKAIEAVRTALATGCDKAILADSSELDYLDEWAAAQLLAKAIGDLPYDIILSGRIAIDDGSSQVAVRLAERLGVPSITSVIKLEIEDGKATATREIDGGTEDLEVELPAVFTAQKGLNEPRLPSMMGIMKAKKKEVLTKSLADLGFEGGLKPKTSEPKFSLPEARKEGKVVPGEPPEAAHELARLLSEEAKAI
jgi:electron transfer flavoprotein beta subunit